MPGISPAPPTSPSVLRFRSPSLSLRRKCSCLWEGSLLCVCFGVSLEAIMELQLREPNCSRSSSTRIRDGSRLTEVQPRALMELCLRPSDLFRQTTDRRLPSVQVCTATTAGAQREQLRYAE